MAYDDNLAQLLRDDIIGLPDISEKHMFGGLCFLLQGNMLCGVHKFAAMYRVGPAQYDQALAVPGVRPLSFTGRPMRGLVDADETEMTDPAHRQALLTLALDFVGQLPAK